MKHYPQPGVDTGVDSEDHYNMVDRVEERFILGIRSGIALWDLVLKGYIIPHLADLSCHLVT